MKIKYNKPNIYSCAGVRLLPGLNVLAAADYDRIKAHPAFLARVESGVIELRGAAPAPKEPEQEASSELTAEEIAELTDVALLRSLAAGKKQLKTTKAAIARLEQIDAAAAE